MRYEFNLIIRVILALSLFIVPLYIFDVNIFQKVFEQVTFDSVYTFLEKSGVDPKPGSFSVSSAITILGGDVTINIVKYCVTASAYYLLAFLCIIIMDVALWKRIFMFLIGSVLIFGMNIVRIVILIIILMKNQGIFEPAHILFNFLLSVGYVLFLWLLLSFLFKVDTIPIYSDFKFLKNEISRGKRK